MSNNSAGHEAEIKAAVFLKTRGYKIIELNWKTRYCEIDIVAEKNKAVYFVEVKYRQNAFQGRGMDYITEKKLKQMTFAAEMWVSSQQWQGEYALSAIELAGVEFEVTEFIETIM